VARLLALLAVLLASLLVGCGGGDSDEVSLGAETDKSQVERNEKRLAELKRRVAALKRRRAEQASQEPDRPAGGGALVGEKGRASFDQLAQRVGGAVGVTIGPVGSPDPEQLGSLTTGKAWSTIKLAIAAKVLQDAGGPGGLSAGQRQSITQALTASDNAAAARLFDGLEAKHGGLQGASEAVGSVLRAAGDDQTVISTQSSGGSSTYGQTDWSLAAQHRFMAQLAGQCILKAGSADYLLGQMGQVVPGQRWGLGSAGVPAKLKGGWGPSGQNGYVVRQVGVLELDGKGVVVTLAAEPSNGQFESGQQMLTELAKWVAANVDPAGLREGGYC
jgi:hypothetical protein